MSGHRLSILAGALALAACYSPADDIGGPLLHLDSRVEGHANGEGTFNIGAPGADIAFQLTAVARADGTALGDVYYVTDLTAFGLGTIEMRFDVICLARDVAQGRAWIGGVVTLNNSTNPTFATDPKRQVGRDVWFRVEDNGNGGSGTPDRSTQLGFEGSAGFLTSLEYCSARPWLAPPPHPVNSGNLSVR